jgi:hypothetical protein
MSVVHKRMLRIDASSSRFGRGLLRAAVAAIAAVALGPAASALAEPALRIESPVSGAQLDSSTPLFRGTAQEPYEFSVELGEEVLDPIIVVISNADRVAVQHVPASTELGSGAWSAVAESLADGSYTAQAIQKTPPPLGKQVGQSEPVPFTIDTTPPSVTIATPANGSTSSRGSQLIGGSAGTAAGDLPTIMIRLFAGGSSAGHAPLETLVVQASGGSWSATFGGLAPGTYTAQAAQGDQAGNTGVSAPVTFTVASPAPPPPIASFKWFPAAPRVGEAVSLVSSSTDSFSPLTGFAWALTGVGPFTPGTPVLTTSFATAGNHVVRLQVTDGEGRSSVATESVPVSGRPLVLMQPFPIVRIAGNVTARGASIRLLTVQAPPAAKVTVTCAGKGCVTKAESRIATSSAKSRAGAVTLSFRRFERSLPGGVLLQIRVTKPGEIGKFTSFAIRRGKLPVRSDACLPPAASKPIPCPAS